MTLCVYIMFIPSNIPTPHPAQLFTHHNFWCTAFACCINSRVCCRHEGVFLQ